MFILQIHSGEGGAGIQALDGDGAVAVDLNAVAEATLNHDGQIILTGEDGHGTCHPLNLQSMSHSTTSQYNYVIEK